MTAPLGRFTLEVRWRNERGILGGWRARALFRTLEDAMYNAEPITAVPARIVGTQEGVVWENGVRR